MNAAESEQREKIPAPDRCWCGVKSPYYAPLPTRCGGDGMILCYCGGDFCACHEKHRETLRYRRFLVDAVQLARHRPIPVANRGVDGGREDAPHVGLEEGFVRPETSSDEL